MISCSKTTSTGQNSICAPSSGHTYVSSRKITILFYRRPRMQECYIKPRSIGSHQYTTVLSQTLCFDTPASCVQVRVWINHMDQSLFSWTQMWTHPNFKPQLKNSDSKGVPVHPSSRLIWAPTSPWTLRHKVLSRTRTKDSSSKYTYMDMSTRQISQTHSVRLHQKSWLQAQD